MFEEYVKKIGNYEEYLTNLEKTQLAMEIEIFDQKMLFE